MLLLGHMQKQMENHSGHRRFPLKNQAQLKMSFQWKNKKLLVERSTMKKNLQKQ